jgi:signal transduction histidine kinase
MKSSPQLRFALASLVIALMLGASILAALQAPVTGVHLVADAEGRVVIDRVDPGSPNAEKVQSGEPLHRLGGLALEPSSLYKEPDQSGDWVTYNNLVSTLGQLDEKARSGNLGARVADREVKLRVRERRLTDLPAMFWFQVSIGVIAFLITAGVWAFRQRDPGARHFLVAGLGTLLFTNAAAAYTTRELLFDGNLLWTLSMANHLGAFFFSAALLALLWNYPRRLGRFPLDYLAYAGAGLGWLANVFQITPDVAFSYVITLALFAPSFLLAAVQWFHTRQHPVERAALKWFLLSIYLGTILFAVMVLLPAALGLPPFATQGLAFVVFLFMFIGIALGITRYRLFDLDRWWLNAWSWFLGGLAVILIDLVLVSLLTLNQGTMLALSLAVVGWLYFPVRQRLFRLIQGGRNRNQLQVGRLVQDLFSAEDPEQLARLWRSHITEEWDVLDWQETEGTLETPRIAENGETLYAPHLVASKHLALHYPDHGRRLFHRADTEQMALLHQIARQALQGLNDRQQALDEKQRIFSDLHDDVGAKLLSLLYRARDPDSGELARSALRDLRDVVSQPVESELPLRDCLADWRAEAQERLDGTGIGLSWQQGRIATDQVSVFFIRHMARVLRECINNVIRHASASSIRITLEEEGGQLALTVEDNGKAGDPRAWRAGQGTRNIRHRVSRLRGTVAWQETVEGGCLIRISVPLEDESA